MARCACGPPTAEHWRRRCRVAQGQRVAQGRRFEESEGAEAQRIAQAGRPGAGRLLAQARDSLGYGPPFQTCIVAVYEISGRGGEGLARGGG